MVSLHYQEVLQDEHSSELEETLYRMSDGLLDFLLYRYNSDYSEVMETLTETGQYQTVIITWMGERLAKPSTA
jgi:hypothetical protein